MNNLLAREGEARGHWEMKIHQELLEKNEETVWAERAEHGISCFSESVTADSKMKLHPFYSKQFLKSGIKPEPFSVQVLDYAC